MTLAPAVLALALAGAGDGPGDPRGRDLVFLAEDRPVFVRLRITRGGRPFEDGWNESFKPLHACLDRDGDGTLTAREASAEALAALVGMAVGPGAMPPAGLDAASSDGAVSVDELADMLRPVLGPFRVAVSRLATGRTDALFDDLDRDKDGALTRAELAAITGSLRRLDLDDNELITPDELEPFNSPALMARTEQASQRLARYTAVPPVVEIVAGESSLRLARVLLKKYDRGRDDTPGRPDGRLSQSEFPIDAGAFAAADRNGDDRLDVDDLRRFLGAGPVDVTLDVGFSPRTGESASLRVASDGPRPQGVEAHQRADGDLELSVGRARLDVRVDERGEREARETLLRRFRAADANRNGYLEGKELAALGAAGSPLAGLTEWIDRDGDGKLYANELSAFIDRQAESARGRAVVAVSDQGRAVFRILDRNRDRRLSPREVTATVARVGSWDNDADGRVTADEIPYHFLVTVGRGTLLGVAGDAPGAARPEGDAAPSLAGSGPEWFRQMDRNRDGDVSHREFLGPREQFGRLDRDKDGLIDADEAAHASTPD